MSLINKNGLLSRLTVSIVFMALIVGFIVSELFYRINYTNDLAQAKDEISKLNDTVSATTSIAAFLEDEELANEVLNGLILNDIIKSAQLNTAKFELIKGEVSSSDTIYQFDVRQPFGPEIIGSLSLGQNTAFIQQRANQKALYNYQALYAQSFFITLITVIVVYLLVSKPLTQISAQLSSITPPSKNRVQLPEYQSKSELGSLVNDVNLLLTKADEYLSHEVQYRKEIQVLEQRFRLIFENAKAPIILTDIKGNLVLSNDAFSQMLEQCCLNARRSFGLYLSDLFENPKVVEMNISKQLSFSDTASGEFKIINIDGSVKWLQLIVTRIHTEQLKEYTEIILNDITSKKEKLKQLSTMIDLDPLTQVLNRNGLSNLLSELLTQNENFALVFIDLNGFKKINDTFGHKAGDTLLKHVAIKISEAIRVQDSLARIGGDEFIIILKGISKQNIINVLEKIKRNIETKVNVDSSNSLTVSAAFGVSFYPSCSIDSEELIHMADEAMYAAKTTMKNSSELFYQLA